MTEVGRGIFGQLPLFAKTSERDAFVHDRTYEQRRDLSLFGLAVDESIRYFRLSADLEDEVMPLQRYIEKASSLVHTGPSHVFVPCFVPEPRARRTRPFSAVWRRAVLIDPDHSAPSLLESAINSSPIGQHLPPRRAWMTRPDHTTTKRARSVSDTSSGRPLNPAASLCFSKTAGDVRHYLSTAIWV